MGGVDDREVIVGFTNVAGSKVLKDECVPARIGDIRWTSAAADNLGHLIEYKLSEVKTFVLDNAV